MRILLLILCFIIVNNSYSQDTLDCEGVIELVRENKVDLNEYFFKKISNPPPCSPTGIPPFELGIPFLSRTKMFISDEYFNMLEVIFNDYLSKGLYKIKLNYYNSTFFEKFPSGVYYLIVNTEQSGNLENETDTQNPETRFEGYEKFLIIK